MFRISLLRMCSMAQELYTTTKTSLPVDYFHCMDNHCGVRFQAPIMIGIRTSQIRGLFLATNHHIAANQTIATIPLRKSVWTNKTVMDSKFALPSVTLERVRDALQTSPKEFQAMAPQLHLGAQFAHMTSLIPESRIVMREEESDRLKNFLEGDTMPWLRMIDDENFSEEFIYGLYGQSLDKWQRESYFEMTTTFRKVTRNLHEALQLPFPETHLLRISRLILARAEHIPELAFFNKSKVTKLKEKLMRKIQKKEFPRDLAMVPLLDMVNHSNRPNTHVKFHRDADGEPVASLISITNIEGGAEICRHYNFAITRAAALFRYGFLPFDIITIVDHDPAKENYFKDGLNNMVAEAESVAKERAKEEAEISRLETIFKESKGKRKQEEKVLRNREVGKIEHSVSSMPTEDPPQAKMSVTINIPEMAPNTRAEPVENNTSPQPRSAMAHGHASLAHDTSFSKNGGTSKRVRLNSITQTQSSGNFSLVGAAPVKNDEEDGIVSKRGGDELHPFWLTFKDPEQEVDYCIFAYVLSGFYGGKLWHILAFAIIGISFFYYHTMHHGWDVNMFGKPYWVALTVTALVTVLMTICLFVERLAPYRETFFLISLFTHWPAFLIAFFFGMDVFVYNYAMVTGCYFFCAFVVQARFSRVVWFLSVSPLLTLIVATNAFPFNFWEKHSVLEIVYWLAILFPVLLLRSYERYSRMTFLQMVKCENKIHDIESKIGKTQQLIAKFFPKTPTLDLLTDGRHLTRCKVYHDTALVVTDLAGFTAWTSRTPPSVVISTLSLMFENIDSQLDTYYVEKVSTIGDAFIGASFPNGCLTIEQRCSITISFCCNILPYGGELKLRIGTHIGEVTGAFVGSAPPKFDIFGEDVEIAKVMEQDGVPGKVHITPKMLALAVAHGHPTEREQGKSGIVTEGWITEAAELNEVLMRNDDDLDAEELEAKNFSPFEVFKVSQALMTMGKDISTADLESNISAVMGVESSVVSLMPQETRESMGLGGGAPSGVVHPLEVENLETRNSSIFAGTTLSPSSLMTPGSTGKRQASSNLMARLEASSRRGSRRGSQDSNASILGGLEGGGPKAPHFHPLLLKFDTPAHERMFAKFLRKANLTDRTVFMFTIMLLFFAICHMMLGCLETDKNRWLTGAVFGVVLIDIILFRKDGSKVPYLTPILLGSTAAICLLTVFQDADCKFGEYYTGVTISLYVLMTFIVSQFLLMNRLLIRIGLNFASLVFGILLMVIRNEVMKDNVLPYDPIWVVGVLGIGFVSYFADFTLRSAFVADRKLMSALKLTKGRHHQTTKGALEVMLPGFVSDRLLGDEPEEETAGSPGNGDELSSSLTMSGSELSVNLENSSIEDEIMDASNMAASAKLWEFHSVGVMFVYFNTHHQGSEEHHIEIINQTFSTIEGILKAANIHKIKTIGTAVMCVYGINDDEADPVNLIVKTALDIRRKVLEAKLGWTYTFGIHLGPCTGAVMGTESLMFDIFGDSVNMASRMASTAPPKGIQLSPGAAVALSDDFKTEKRPPIQVKGKGQIEPIVVLGHA